MNSKYVIYVSTSTGSSKSAEENLGIAYLSSVCRSHGIETDIIDGWLENLNWQDMIERIISSISRRRPIFIGFSSNMLNANSTMEVASVLKEKKIDIPLIAGGFGPTFDPYKFLKSGFDYVSMQEGETSVLKICSFLLGEIGIQDVPNFCYITESGSLEFTHMQSVENLDTLPFPARDTMNYVIKARTPVNVITSRGCKGSCLFCSVDAFWRLGNTKKWRQRTIRNIVDEIEELYKNGVRYIKFVDDSFLEPPRDEKWCNDFADEILQREIHIHFRITVRADRITKEKIVALRRAGLDSVACGIENYSDSALERMGKTANSSQNCMALDIFKECDIYVQTGFILFDYGTTMDELWENYHMMKKYSWTICKGIFSEMYAAKGTRYTDQLIKDGIISGNVKYGNYIYELSDKKVQLAYHALKAWHIHHIRMYNMVVEPLNKPKALNNDEMKLFYNLYYDVRQLDISFFGQVLSFLKDSSDVKKLDDLIIYFFEQTDKWYLNQKSKIEQIYKQIGIKYMAEDDPFTVNTGTEAGFSAMQVE